ncbi:hypothetical protein [Kordia jejudonensis]|uniref:hypothetical protein n=1 Tax=Kordia jejudonensis TaxID=1348245 RepID=UPI00062942A9|nr:hypothetical protein [Kordia jejudonensis]
MKKRNFKSLQLNKKSISSLNSADIKGGTSALLSMLPGVACAPGGSEGTCINTHCEDGIVCDLQVPKPKQDN